MTTELFFFVIGTSSWWLHILKTTPTNKNLIQKVLPVVNLFLTRDSLYSWLLSSKFSFEMVAPLHENWTAIRDGVLGPCVNSNLALKIPNNRNKDYVSLMLVQFLDNLLLITTSHWYGIFITSSSIYKTIYCQLAVNIWNTI